MPHRFLLYTLLVLCLSAPGAFAQREAPQTFSGRVVAVTDGDTLGVLRDGKEVKVRFHGIDAPEVGQPFSEVAKKFVSERVFGKTITVRVTDTDRYGRTVGEILLPDPKNAGVKLSLNEMILTEGLAWWYHQYGAKDRHFALAEITARAARKGLWEDANPMPPWAFRNPAPAPNAGGDGSRPKVAESSVGNGRAPQLKPAVAAAEPQGVTVYVTRTGAKYHRDGCRHLKSRIASSLNAARAQGLTACSVCRP